MAQHDPSAGSTTLRLAVWQGRCVDGDVESNLAAAHRAIRFAEERRADFLCLPETFLSGYGSRETIERGAMALNDPRLAALADAARSLVLLVGLTERLSDGALVIFSPHYNAIDAAGLDEHRIPGSAAGGEG